MTRSTPPTSSRRSRSALLAVLAAYALLIVIVAAYPGPIDRPVEGSILRVLAVVHRWGVPEAFSYSTVEFLANVVFYAPIAAVLAGVVRPSGRFWVVVGLAATSTLIELIQSQMPNRVGSVLDVVANTLGALLGVSAVWAFRTLSSRRASAKRS